MPDLDTVPTFTPAQLADATDTDLDAALVRLYGLHHAAHLDLRPMVHAAIADVLSEQGRRLDAWLAKWTTPSK